MALIARPCLLVRYSFSQAAQTNLWFYALMTAIAADTLDWLKAISLESRCTSGKTPLNLCKCVWLCVCVWEMCILIEKFNISKQFSVPPYWIFEYFVNSQACWLSRYNYNFGNRYEKKKITYKWLPHWILLLWNQEQSWETLKVFSMESKFKTSLNISIHLNRNSFQI